jgi:hypothetical protein
MPGIIFIDKKIIIRSHEKIEKQSYFIKFTGSKKK